MKYFTVEKVIWDIIWKSTILISVPIVKKDIGKSKKGLDNNNVSKKLQKTITDSFSSAQPPVHDTKNL